MSMKIDMTNYEAFYLDYLEGGLSGEVLEAFEAFLLAHPELAVEDPFMPTLEAPEEAYDVTGKLVLKKSIELADLNNATIDFFLIAREEGQLTPEQEAHLNHWLEANAHYRRDASLYALTKFEADETVVFGHKEALKKRVGGRVIPLWFTGLAVAAGLALLVTIGINTPGSDNTKSSGEIARQKPVTEQYDTAQKDANDTAAAQKQHTAQKQNKPWKRGQHNSQAPKQQPVNGGEHKPAPKKRPNAYQRNILLQETVVASLEKRNPVLHHGTYEVEPFPQVVKPVPSVSEEPATNDMAWTPLSQMKNPIQPVTAKLSTTLNTPVDFRTAKANRKKGGGFYLKIGKFEVSHQSGSQSASL